MTPSRAGARLARLERRAQRRRRRAAWWAKRRAWAKERIEQLGRALVHPWTFLLLGWASVTFAIGWAAGHWVVVIAASIGLLLLGLYGLQTLWVTVKLGLRALSKMQRQTPDDR